MGITYRLSTPADIDALCHHREATFSEMGADEGTLAVMRPVHRQWLQPHLATGQLFGFLAEDAQLSVGCVNAFVFGWPPGPWHPTIAERAYIFDVHVEAGYRRRGIAKKLMQLIEAELEKRQISYAALRPSEMGQALYEKMGWKPTGEMAKRIGTG